ncbi:MAG: cupredoxin domain-containing protein [Dehalococcoidia bacterium]
MLYRIARPLIISAILPALLIGAALIVATSCGGGRDKSDDAVSVGGMNETVVMDNTKFEPGNLQVPAGATVTFTNRDAATHDAQAEDESWETDNLENGDSEAVTFDAAGEWLYKCTLHPTMKARITVVGDTPQTPATDD